VKTFFSWLGVTYYLSTEAINTMLAALSELCADGSSLVFDYPDENFFDASEKRVQNTIMMAKAGGEPMQSAFSYSEIEKLLEKHGFLIYELLTPDDIQRDIIDKAGTDMKAFEHVNYCLAVRKN
jgi:O-methyltransferase involved in polyketide biosynthesis